MLKERLKYAMSVVKYAICIISSLNQLNQWFSIQKLTAQKEQRYGFLKIETVVLKPATDEQLEFGIYLFSLEKQTK